MLRMQVAALVQLAEIVGRMRIAAVVGQLEICGRLVRVCRNLQPGNVLGLNAVAAFEFDAAEVNPAEKIFGARHLPPIRLVLAGQAVF